MKPRINYEEFVGKKFGRLTVMSFSHRNWNSMIIMNCKCDCGNITKTFLSVLKNGKSKSCGCLREIPRVIDNMYKTPTYNSWDSMIQRCNNLNCEAYGNYGGRGIKVCERWSDFNNFYEDMGECPETFTIDRIDNNGNYEPENCKWSDFKRQQRNKRINRILEVCGIKKCLTEWCEIYNINYQTVRNRLSHRNMSPEEALTVPLYQRKNEQ